VCVARMQGLPEEAVVAASDSAIDEDDDRRKVDGSVSSRSWASSWARWLPEEEQWALLTASDAATEEEQWALLTASDAATEEEDERRRLGIVGG